MVKKGFEIVEASSIVEELQDYRDNYHRKGKYLGFKNIDDLYTMQLGTCTDWTGFPRSGKTQVLMELLLNTSLYYGWKHLVYFPDVGNKTEIIADLVHKKTGKTFNPQYQNTIDDKTIYREAEWICEHFKVLTKSDVKAKLTPYEFFDMAAKMSSEIQTASIDSWKDLNHPYAEKGGYAQYLEDVLPYRNQVAEDNNIHIHTVIHPKLTEKVNGVRKAPTPYDLKGGSEWFNSGKCMITIHRENPEGNIADFYVNKVKPRSCGNVGNTCLNFDIEKFVYFTLESSTVGNKRIYASAKDEPKKIETPKPLQPNLEFDKEDINHTIEPKQNTDPMPDDWFDTTQEETF
jgi:hypothetical protein